jgi:uncharacterized protein YkwD
VGLAAVVVGTAPRMRPSLSLRRCAATLAVCGAGLAAAAPAAADDCANANAEPDDVSLAAYAAALVCEVNEQRQAFGRPALSPQRNLDAAAGWHSQDMVGKGYFGHSEPDGDTLLDRLERAHYIPVRSDRWAAGENLAAGNASEGTPASIAEGWMNSSEHRYNLLDPDFTGVGIGVARGWPAPGDDRPNAITITMDLGWRVLNPRRSA